MRVLLTSFEPFGGHPINSSHEVGKRLAQSPPDGVHLDWLVLPVVAQECVDRAWQHVEQHSPSLILALGQASGSPNIRLEDRGVNRDHFSFADNAGNLHLEKPILPNGPPLYRTLLPIEQMHITLKQAGHRVEHSLSAGSYICNHYYYQLLHRTVNRRPSIRTLFVHLPMLPEQVQPGQKIPTLPVEAQVACVQDVLRMCVE